AVFATNRTAFVFSRLQTCPTISPRNLRPKYRHFWHGNQGDPQGEDDAPRVAILQQKALLDPKYRAAIQAYDAFLASNVAAFNQAMTARHLTGVVIGPTLTP
ncbi:MAG: hypothetical protein ACREVO_07830, partial [Steroidobacteraceae bacterium]